ncbi:MAG: tRNA adenosine(34) deaminase TadA [bacterium]
MMRAALAEARRAGRAGEVPVGAAVALGARILARAGNRTVRDADPTAHAEIIVLRRAARRVGNERLTGATLYATVEPCPMCAGAAVWARVARVVYGARDPRAGAYGSALNLARVKTLNHRPRVRGGVQAPAARALLTDFFRARR